MITQCPTQMITQMPHKDDHPNVPHRWSPKCPTRMITQMSHTDDHPNVPQGWSPKCPTRMIIQMSYKDDHPNAPQGCKTNNVHQFLDHTAHKITLLIDALAQTKHRTNSTWPHSSWLFWPLEVNNTNNWHPTCYEPSYHPVLPSTSGCHSTCPWQLADQKHSRAQRERERWWYQASMSQQWMCLSALLSAKSTWLGVRHQQLTSLQEITVLALSIMVALKHQ